jgi:siroheme synthase-like protein
MTVSEKGGSSKGNTSYYPVFFDLRGRLCVVVGGGGVALRKVKGLLSSKAKVRVIGAEIVQGIKILERAGKIEVVEREYRAEDLNGAFLVWAATNDRDTNRRVKRDSESLSIAANVVDAPESCDFITPSVIRKGPILVAVSTSGISPTLSRKLKGEIMKIVSDEYVAYVRKMGRFREYVKAAVSDPRLRRRILKEAARMGISEAAAMTLEEMKERLFPC